MAECFANCGPGAREVSPGVEGLFLAGEYLHPFSSVNSALASGVDAAGEAARFLER